MADETCWIMRLAMELQKLGWSETLAYAGSASVDGAALRYGHGFLLDCGYADDRAWTMLALSYASVIPIPSGPEE